MSPEQARPRVAGNPAYVRCQRLLKRLQELMAAGQGESAEADAVRDAMDRAARELAPAEADRIENLSADLYMLTDEELPQDVSAEERATLVPRMGQAFQAKRYEEVLALLRLGPASLPREQIAYVRGVCWAELGDYAPAAWFLQYAAELAPRNPSYPALALEAIWNAGRHADAAERARDILADPSSQPLVTVFAAYLLFRFRWEEQQAVAEAAGDYEQVITALERAVEQEESLPASQRILPLSLAGRVYRALSLERLGRDAEARRAFTELTRLYPENSDVLTLAGLFELGLAEGQAGPFFEQAVKLKTHHVWPYLYLAHQRVMKRAFQEVIDLCAIGTEHAKRQEDLARFLEWSAIAHYELGAPDETVRELFNAAIERDPLNFRLRQNRDALEKFALAQHRGPRPEFEASPAPDSGEALREVSAAITPRAA